jgi:hypothetical protein
MSMMPVPVLVLVFVLVLVAVLLMLLPDTVEAEDEELVIEWVDGDHVREFGKRTMHSFNFTMEYVGPRPSVRVKYLFDSLPPGLWMYPVSEEMMDVDEESFYYRSGTRYNGTFWVSSSPAVLNGTYWVNLTFSIKDNYEVYTTDHFGFIVRQHADFVVELDNVTSGGDLGVMPPGSTTVWFTLHNMGNGYDTFLVNVSSPGTARAWKVDVVAGVRSSGHTPRIAPDLERERPHYIGVRVTPPVDAAAGTRCTLTVTARSDFAPSMYKPPASAFISTLQYYGFEVGALQTHVELDRPKAQVEFLMDIHNTGNGWDTFSVHASWDAARNPGFIAAANPNTVTVAQWDVGRVVFIVLVPDDVPQGSYYFDAEVASSSPELLHWSVGFCVEVGQFYSIGMEAMPEGRSTRNGRTVVFDVTVRNTGNGLDSVVLLKARGLPESWLVYIQPSELTLLQGQEALVEVVVVVPSDFREAPVGNYSLVIPAKSTRGNSSSEVLMTIEVTPFHDVYWLYDDNAPSLLRSVNPYQQNWIGYTFEVRNFGNVRDTVGFYGTSDSPLIAVTPTPNWTALDLGESRSVAFRVEMPVDLPAGRYTCYASVLSLVSEGMVPRVIEFEFEVERVDVSVPPIPTHVSPDIDGWYPLELAFGSNASFKLKVENNGTLPVDHAVLRAYDNYVLDGRRVRWNFFNFTVPSIAVGDRYVVGERPFTGYNPPMYWWANVSGNHTLEFRVHLDHQAETGNDVAYLEVRVGPAPVGGSGPTEATLVTAGTVVASALIAVVAVVALFGVRMKLRQIKYG